MEDWKLTLVRLYLGQVLCELGLLGLRIQRMPSTPGQEFGIPAEYNYMTVCAPSCHDSSTMRAWWEEDEGRRSRYFRNVLGFNESPPATCEPRVAHIILQQHLEAPSVWAIFPIQDLLALKEVYSRRPAKEETINNPTNPRHYWRFSTFIHNLFLFVLASLKSGCKGFGYTLSTSKNQNLGSVRSLDAVYNWERHSCLTHEDSSYSPY